MTGAVGRARRAKERRTEKLLAGKCAIMGCEADKIENITYCRWHKNKIREQQRKHREKRRIRNDEWEPIR